MRRTGQVFGLVMALVVLCPLLLAVLPGSWLARPASAMASSWLNMSVNIRDVAVKPFSLTPTVVLRNLDALSTSDSAVLQAREVTASLSLRALLKGEFVIDRLSISDAALEGKIDEQGHASWRPAATTLRQTEPGSLLRLLRTIRIDDLVLDSLRVELANAHLQTRFSLTIQGAASTYDASKSSQWHVTGFADGQAVKLDARISFLGDLFTLPATGSAPVTLDITASVGDDALTLKGAVGTPASPRDVDAVISIQVSSLEHWQAFVPFRLPALPAFDLAGVLTKENEDWRLRHVEAHYGRTDISGDFRLDSSRQPMVLDAGLTSAILAVDEFAPLRPIVFKSLPVHGSIDYRAQQVVSDQWPLESIELSAEMDERRVSVLLDRIKLGGGELEGEIVRNLQSVPVVTQVRLALKRLDLQKLLPTDASDSLRAGQLAARVELSMAGQTPSAMRGSVEGVLTTLMTGDWLDTLLQGALGVDLARSLMVDRGAPAKRYQNCAFIELQAAEGIVQLRSLVFDTDTTVYLGDGEFDWENQSIDLTIEPHKKSTAVNANANANADTDKDAVYISGMLSEPVVESVHAFLTRDSAVSVLDATITPAVALMPFLNVNFDGPDILCQGLASALDDSQ